MEYPCILPALAPVLSLKVRDNLWKENGPRWRQKTDVVKNDTLSRSKRLCLSAILSIFVFVRLFVEIVLRKTEDKVVFYVCLCGFLSPFRNFFNHLRIYVKITRHDDKFRPSCMFHSYGHWAVIFLACQTYMVYSNTSVRSSPVTHDINTRCPALGSGTDTTCFNDFGLSPSLQGFEHTIFPKLSNQVQHPSGKSYVNDACCDTFVVKERNLG